MHVDTRDFHQESANGLFFETIHGSLSILVRKDEPECRIDIVADLLPPSGDEAFNYRSTELLWVKTAGAVRALLPPSDGWPCRSFDVVVKRIQQGKIEIMER